MENMAMNGTMSGSMPGMMMLEPDNQGFVIVVVALALLASNVMAVSLRVVSQVFYAKAFGINDVFMIIVNAIFAALVTFLLLGINDGVGKHTAAVLASGAATISGALKWIFFLEFFYVILTTIMKMSLAISLWQWARTTWHKYVLVTAIIVDVVAGSIVTVYTAIQCNPISYQWTRLDPTTSGTCRDQNEIITVGFALVGTTVFLDMLFLALPLFMLKDYKLNARLRMYIYGVLFIGVLASLANFIRLTALSKLSTFKDPLFDSAPVFLWSLVEVSLGIFVAGILKIAPMLSRWGVKGFEVTEGEFGRMDDEVPLKDMDVKSYNISKPF